MACNIFFSYTSSLSSLSTAMNASWGTSTLPTDFILFFPSAYIVPHHAYHQFVMDVKKLKWYAHIHISVLHTCTYVNAFIHTEPYKYIYIYKRICEYLLFSLHYIIGGKPQCKMKASQKNENNKNYYQADVTHTHIHTVPYVSTHNTCIGREESATYEKINVFQLVA